MDPLRIFINRRRNGYDQGWNYRCDRLRWSGAGTFVTQREDVEIVWYGSRSYMGEDFASIYRNTAYAVNEPCKDDDMAKLAEIAGCDLHRNAQGFCASQVTEDILSKTKIIDLSADFRIKDVDVYEKWYKIKHATPAVHR